VPLIIDTTVNHFDPLGPGSPDYGTWVITKTVDELADMNGTDLNYGDPVITQVVEWVGRQGREANWMQDLLAKFDVKPYVGDTTNLELGAGNQVPFVVKSVVNDGAVFIGVDELVDGADVQSITGRNGAALPAHMVAIGKRGVLANVHAGARWIELDVIGKLKNGQSFKWAIAVNPTSGEILDMDTGHHRDRQAAAPSRTMTNQLANYHAPHADGQRALLKPLKT
jgi:hypothetical protein